jgi:PKD repeat protein
MFNSRIRPMFLAVSAAGLSILVVVAVAAGAAGPATTCTVPGSHATIQAAVDDLNCDLIDVAAGTFTENVYVPVSRTVTIQGQGPLSTTVDGGGGPSVFRIFQGNVHLSNLAIVNGFSPQGGGGIHISSGTVIVDNCVLSGNEDFSLGGGAIFNGSQAATVINNCTLSDNTAIQGGGILNWGTLTIISSTLRDNSAGSGGGIFNTGTLTVHGSVLSGNSADEGGGVVNFGGVFTLTNGTLTANLADNGGAVLNYGTNALANIRSSTISGNAADYGGAVHNLSATLTISNSILSGNSVITDGGGIFNDDGATAIIASSILTGNQASHYGGGIYNSGRASSGSENSGSRIRPGNWVVRGGGTLDPMLGTMLANNGPLSGNLATPAGLVDDGGMMTVTNSTLSGNWAIRGGGIFNGGAAVINNSRLAVNDSTLSGNSASHYGGGIANEWSTVTINNSTLSGNSASYTSGGIANVVGTLTINNSSLTGNSAGDHAGGIGNFNSTATINDSTVSNNTAGRHSGGIDNQGLLTVNNSTLSGNFASWAGGISHFGGTVTVTNSTLSGNSASRYAGGIFIGGGYIANMGNTILAGNQAPEGPDCFAYGTLVSQDYNLVESTADCTITGSTAHNIYGQDPVLGPLQDNGGPTWTQALLPGSPAIDAGNCPGQTEDQRGFPRPVDLPAVPNAADGCDIGAFEVQGGLCTVPLGYPTIQAAVDDLNCNLIDVAAGTFLENVDVPVSRTVTIQGQGPLSTTVDGGGGSSVFRIFQGNVHLSNLAIVNGLSLQGGGGIHISSGTVFIDNCDLSGNKDFSLGGGAIFNGSQATTVISNCTLSDNTAFLGGGVLNWGTLTIISSTLRDNSVGNGSGGGIFNDSGTLAVHDSILTGNSAFDGGGVVNFGGVFTLTNSTLTANLADNGGAVLNYGTNALANIRSSTISGNAADYGGGIYNAGQANFAHTILADHTTSLSGPDCYGTLNSLDFNLVEDTADCTITGSTAHNIYGQDPVLGPLQDNGGPTWTQALLPGSPAIDAGNNATCPAYDQRGLPRPRDGDGDGQADCDIGAFELQDVAIAGLTATNDSPTALGQPTTFTATITAGTNVAYAWDFGDGANGSGPVASHTYAAAGPHTATVTAANLVSNDTAETPVIIEEAIGGLAAVNDSPTILGQPTTFTATITAGTSVTYSWDFGDGANGSGPVASHTYAAAGPYTATVTAANQVSTATAETPAIVEEAISGLTAVNDSPTLLGQPTTFTATIAAGTNVTYTWEFGDGAAGTGAVVTHTYTAAGPYTATVTAANAVSSATAETGVTVEEAISGLAAVNDSPTALGQPTTFTATIAAGTHVTYAWDFGDGAAGSGAVVTHTYAAAGPYTATVTATNPVSSATAETGVLVEEAISGLAAANDSPTALGQPTTFTATITAGTNVTYTWDFGDGAAGSGPVISHTYAAAGPYTATVTAANLVSSDTAETPVIVEEQPDWPVYLPAIFVGASTASPPAAALPASIPFLLGGLLIGVAVIRRRT